MDGVGGSSGGGGNEEEAEKTKAPATGEASGVMADTT